MGCVDDRPSGSDRVGRTWTQLDAEADGQVRLADNFRRVQDSLERIIPALEALQDHSSP